MKKRSYEGHTIELISRRLRSGGWVARATLIDVACCQRLGLSYNILKNIQNKIAAPVQQQDMPA